MPDGRVSLVTGGAGGIGAAICRELAQAGYRVAVADINLPQAEELANEINAYAVAVDVADAQAVSKAVDEVLNEFGSVDILVNNAGWDEFIPFLETDEAFMEKVLAINLEGPMRLTRLLLPGMVERGWGRIVNVASDAGRVGSSLEAVYSGAKGGLIAFTKTIAREVAKKGVTANAVCPGPTDTPLLQKITTGSERAEKLGAALTRAVPMGRLGRPEDIAPAVVFLASDGAAFITGQTLSVSGGLTMA